MVDAKPEAVSVYERPGFVAFELVEGASLSRPAPRAMLLPRGSLPP